MDEKNKQRYERKFFVDNFIVNNLGDLKSFLPIEINMQYKQRIINSIYYDTFDYKLSQENINGLFERKKIRIRYYGLCEKLKSPRLELKKKFGLIGEKRYFKLDKNILKENKFSLANVRIKNLNINDINLLKIIEPKVIVSYKRDYFISPCNRYRFTLDRDILFKSFSHINMRNNFSSEFFYRFKKTIIEFKYSLIDEDDAYKITRNLPSRLTSSSKYLLALKHLGLIY